MENRFYTYKRVGYFKERMAENLGVKFTGTIYASQGVIKHIKKKHGKHLGKKITSNILECMKEIIENPDYIGVYKLTDNGIHIELIKKAETNILIGIDINDKRDYIYVSTMYPITDGKIYSRLFSGKLIQWQ
ncbi:PBECR2 nuclease fold domain-containing protein [Clostridium sp. AL.422]|uniref:PBECR3 domain-containing polyvalent protein n=1 Tax=Clostridium TaxID=1485 RepID=UPI00293DBCBA|nr:MULTISPECIES: PBECR2 nuclease fold domain-containing protein [unclassified Clostridium]MDV4151230.1 PBECR2 nuclease fold domain-containing protein [Clostridium sp. AL.422]